MTPDVFFMGCAGVGAVSSVVVAISSALGARRLRAVPELVAEVRQMRVDLGRNTVAATAAQRAAEGAAQTGRSGIAVLEEEMRTRRARDKATVTGNPRSVSASDAGLVLAREPQPSRPDAEPPTARGGVEGKAVVG